ncbi:proline dehydrogenase family protein [Sphingobacterium hungaricum]
MEVPNKNTQVNFDNTEIAFQHKSNKDLEKAYWLFKMVASNALIKIGTPITTFSLNIGLPIQGIIKNTIYKQFCGGESIEDCRKSIDELAVGNVTTILDYSVEGEETEQSFDETFQELLRAIDFAKTNPHISFSVFKPTGLGRFDLFAKVNEDKPLTSDEQAEFDRVLTRIDAICKASYEADIRVLIDAEHSWVQDSIDDIARDMMQKYNKEKPLVYNTYQLYRHDKLASLKADFAFAELQGFHIGAKIVRGAYMEIERERAKEMGYPSPINPTKEATDKEYDDSIRFCLDHADKIGFMAGTHNEESSNLLVHEMQKRQISPENKNIFFAQLLGMSDNLSFNLAAAGYNVGKYMPYGPVKAVMPYLFRRAQENTSVGGQTGRELGLIIKEKKRRKAAKK